MSVSWTYKVIFTVVLLGLASVGCDADKIKEFKTIRDEIFSDSGVHYSDYRIKRFIERMIFLVESGDIPAEIQGKYNLEYLKSLESDCNDQKCNFKDVVAKLKRISKKVPEVPNLDRYFELCRIRIRSQCANVIYDHVKANFKLDRQSKKIVDAFADEVENTFFSWLEYRYNTEEIYKYDFHEIVLTTLRSLDPGKSKKIAEKWINKGSSLRAHMDKIRSSCVAFLETIEPAVELYPAVNPGYASEDALSELPRLHFTLKACKKIVKEWEQIVSSSRKDYDRYLIHQKPRKAPYYGPRSKNDIGPVGCLAIVAFGAAG